MANTERREGIRGDSVIHFLSMRRFRSPKDALTVMLLCRGWVGTPLIKRGDEVFDGSIRLEAWSLGKFPGEPPTRIATTGRELARLLVVCGELTRAQQLLGGAFDDYATAQAMLGLDRQLSEGMIVQPTRPKRRDYSAKGVVQRIRTVIRAAREDGVDSVRVDALSQLIGEEWL